MPLRKCMYCKERFPKEDMIIVPVGAFCGFDHLNQYQYEKREEANKKEFRAETRRLKEKVKTKGQWAKEAQAEFNRFIRLRDAEKPCISCGRHHQGQYHAGHYRTVGANPELRFNEDNCHKQCAPCNNHLSGNITSYRINLLAKIGQEKLDWLEGPHDPAKYTIDDLKTIKAKYKAKIKVLEAEVPLY